MAEGTNAAADTAGGANAADANAGGDDQIKRTALAGTDADAGGSAGDTTGDTAGGATPPTWREDWREALAGEDEGFLRTLKRYSTVENLGKAFREQQKKITAGQTFAPPPEDAEPEEVAAFRKRMGVPEKADGYGLAFPQEMKPTEADTAALGAFADHMHKAGVPPAFAKSAFDFYTQTMAQGNAAKTAAAEEATLESLGELRSEFKGREFGRNMKIADEFLTKHFGEDPKMLASVNEVLDLRLPNGVKVMHHAPFMKGLFAMARAYADDEALLGGDIPGSGGKSLETEKDELVAKSVSGKLTKAEDARLNQIYEALTAREAKQGRSRAA